MPRRKTKSAVLAKSIMLLRSLERHSKNVNRRFLPLTTVTGPLISPIFQNVIQNNNQKKKEKKKEKKKKKQKEKD